MIKRSLLVAGTLATVILGGGGLALAATDTTNGGGSSSLVDKIATRFNLNKSEVQSVFDQERKARMAERQADFQERLTEGVSDGDLTQAQADHIKSVLAEINTLRGDADHKNISDEVKDKIHDKMDELRDWAEENDIDRQYVMAGMGKGGHGHHGMGGRDMDDRTSDSTDDDGTADQGSGDN